MFLPPKFLLWIPFLSCVYWIADIFIIALFGFFVHILDTSTLYVRCISNIVPQFMAWLFPMFMGSFHFNVINFINLSLFIAYLRNPSSSYSPLFSSKKSLFPYLGVYVANFYSVWGKECFFLWLIIVLTFIEETIPSSLLTGVLPPQSLKKLVVKYLLHIATSIAPWVSLSWVSLMCLLPIPVGVPQLTLWVRPVCHLTKKYGQFRDHSF